MSVGSGRGGQLRTHCSERTATFEKVGLWRQLAERPELVRPNDDVHVTGNSMIVAGIDKPGLYSSGMPLMGNREWRKNMARLKKLDELARRVTELERDAEK